jgi:hypothetical protein
VYASERLNVAAHDRWRAFSTQDYFDSRGVFVGIVWAGPLILLLCAMLIGFLVRAARLLVRYWPRADAGLLGCLTQACSLGEGEARAAAEARQGGRG